MNIRFLVNEVFAEVADLIKMVWKSYRGTTFSFDSFETEYIKYIYYKLQ